MKFGSSSLIFRCAVIDAFLVVGAALILTVLSGIEAVARVYEKLGVVLAFVLPIAAVVAWRGAAHARSLVAGRRGWVRPAVEGFLTGFLLMPVGHAIGMIQESLACGPLWPTINAPADYWMIYFGFLLQCSLVLGSIGSLSALLISAVNRVVVGRYPG